MTPVSAAARVASPTTALSPADELRAHVVEGLSQPYRELSPRYFYDEAGAALFEAICALDDYYLTRTEAMIHRDHARDIAAAIGPRAHLVELGSGSGAKTRALLPFLESPAGYAPIDVCRPQLDELAAAVAAAWPDMRVTPVCGDFAADGVLPSRADDAGRTVVLYHGSTIGNLHPAEACALLARLRQRGGREARMLVGVDLQKDRELVERAYNDAEGVTAAFNLNLLRRINRECGADIDVDAFEHRASYDARRGRIVMRLVSRRRQTVSVPPSRDLTVPGGSFRFAPGDAVTTEYSYKYSPGGFAALAAGGGWDVADFWTDAAGWFGVWLLRAPAAPA